MWGEIVFLPLAAWQVVLFAVPSSHLHCLHANLSSAMESCFHDSCAQPHCLRVSDNHQNKQLAQMLFLASPFHGPLFPWSGAHDEDFLLSSFPLEEDSNPCQPWASFGSSTYLLVVSPVISALLHGDGWHTHLWVSLHRSRSSEAMGNGPAVSRLSFPGR